MARVISTTSIVRTSIINYTYIRSWIWVYIYFTGGTVETAALADLDSSKVSDLNAASQGGYLHVLPNIPHGIYTKEGGTDIQGALCMFGR